MPSTYEPVYTVWRRSDNYVDASATNGPPRGWTFRDMDTKNLVIVSFEELLVTADWPAAAIRIKAERVADEMNGIMPAWV